MKIISLCNIFFLTGEIKHYNFTILNFIDAQAFYESRFNVIALSIAVYIPGKFLIRQILW